MRFYTRRVAVVPVIKNLTKRGNSLALVIEKPVLELLGANADTAFDVSTDGQVLILSPIRDAARREAFSGATFRVYTNNDALGAEYAGALKNVIAIAAGISDGLELGDNAKSALLVRGMVEIARFACARGAKPETFFGLAGVGDLATTCFSRHSRNRAVGEALGRGRKLADVLASTRTVAEGVYTTQALFGPEADLGDLPMPIAAQVHAVLFRGKDPREAVLELMTRAPAGEMDGIGEARVAEARS